MPSVMAETVPSKAVSWLPSSSAVGTAHLAGDRRAGGELDDRGGRVLGGGRPAARRRPPTTAKTPTPAMTRTAAAATSQVSGRRRGSASGLGRGVEVVAHGVLQESGHLRRVGGRQGGGGVVRAEPLEQLVVRSSWSSLIPASSRSTPHVRQPRRSFAAPPRSFSRARCSRMLTALGVTSRTAAISAGVSCSQAHRRSSSASSSRSAPIASSRSGSSPSPGPERWSRRRVDDRDPGREPLLAAYAPLGVGQAVAGHAVGPGQRLVGTSSSRRQQTSSVSASTSSAVAGSVRRARKRRRGSTSAGTSASNRSRLASPDTLLTVSHVRRPAGSFPSRRAARPSHDLVSAQVNGYAWRRRPADRRPPTSPRGDADGLPSGFMGDGRTLAVLGPEQSRSMDGLPPRRRLRRRPAGPTRGGRCLGVAQRAGRVDRQWAGRAPGRPGFAGGHADRGRAERPGADRARRALPSGCRGSAPRSTTTVSVDIRAGGDAYAEAGPQALLTRVRRGPRPARRPAGRDRRPTGPSWSPGRAGRCAATTSWSMRMMEISRTPTAPHRPAPRASVGGHRRFRQLTRARSRAIPARDAWPSRRGGAAARASLRTSQPKQRADDDAALARGRDQGDRRLLHRAQHQDVGERRQQRHDQRRPGRAPARRAVRRGIRRPGHQRQHRHLAHQAEHEVRHRRHVEVGDSVAVPDRVRRDGHAGQQLPRGRPARGCRALAPATTR